jgi:hypothetical protein
VEWVNAVFLDVQKWLWMKKIKHSNYEEKNTTKEILSLSMVQQEISMMELFLQLKLVFLEISEESWLGLINIEN